MVLTFFCFWGLCFCAFVLWRRGWGGVRNGGIGWEKVVGIVIVMLGGADRVLVERIEDRTRGA